MLIPFEINGKLYHLTNEETQAHIELEEQKEKSAQEAKLLALILNKEHSENIKKEKELRKKRNHQFRWTTSSKLKPEKITDIHIHPNTKQVAIIVYRGNNKRNFDVHKPFRFGDFSVTEWDELGAIIPKKQGSRRPDDILAKEAEKGRHKSWDLRFAFLGLNAIEAFLKEFSFSTTCDIYKVDVDTLLSYMVMALNINTPSNKRFYEIMRSMIENHLDRENLKSKKFKLEAIGYLLN
ncbi:hypothetical protein Tco_0886987 [Tanacetum coccineum]